LDNLDQKIAKGHYISYSQVGAVLAEERNTNTFKIRDGIVEELRER
jgi:hypothetical protein